MGKKYVEKENRTREKKREFGGCNALLVRALLFAVHGKSRPAKTTEKG